MDKNSKFSGSGLNPFMVDNSSLSMMALSKSFDSTSKKTSSNLPSFAQRKVIAESSNECFDYQQAP